MCLAVPAQLVSCDDQGQAVVDLHGNRMSVSVALVPQARTGDWVLIHAGFAIEMLNTEEAQRRWKLLQDAQEAQKLVGASPMFPPANSAPWGVLPGVAGGDR